MIGSGAFSDSEWWCTLEDASKHLSLAVLEGQVAAGKIDFAYGENETLWLWKSHLMILFTKIKPFGTDLPRAFQVNIDAFVRDDNA